MTKNEEVRLKVGDLLVVWLYKAFVPYDSSPLLSRILRTKRHVSLYETLLQEDAILMRKLQTPGYFDAFECIVHDMPNDVPQKKYLINNII